MSDPASRRVDVTAGATAPTLATLGWPLVVGHLLQTAYHLVAGSGSSWSTWSRSPSRLATPS